MSLSREDPKLIKLSFLFDLMPNENKLERYLVVVVLSTRFDKRYFFYSLFIFILNILSEKNKFRRLNSQ